MTAERSSGPRHPASLQGLCTLCLVQPAAWLAAAGRTDADDDERRFGVCGTCRPGAERALRLATGTLVTLAWTALPPAPRRTLEAIARRTRPTAPPRTLAGGERQALFHEMNALERDLAVIDTEWAHPPGEPNELVAIAVRRLQPGGTGYHAAYTVRPDRPVDPATAAVHGYTDELLASARPFGYHAREIYRDVRNADIGGYGVRRDIENLEAAFTDAGIRWPDGVIAVVDGLRLWQRAEPRTLAHALEQFGGRDIEFDAHDAASDAAAAAAVIETLAGDLAARTAQAATDPNLVDSAGKFRRDADGRIIIAFGRHKGRRAVEELDYLDWMTGACFARSTTAVAEDILRHGEAAEWIAAEDEPY